MEKVETNEKKKIKIDTKAFKGALYSQIVGITVTDTDLTLEFVYINTRSGEGEVVSRITLPPKVAEDLATSIIKTKKAHLDRKK